MASYSPGSDTADIYGMHVISVSIDETIADETQCQITLTLQDVNGSTVISFSDDATIYAYDYNDSVVEVSADGGSYGTTATVSLATGTKTQDIYFETTGKTSPVQLIAVLAAELNGYLSYGNDFKEISGSDNEVCYVMGGKYDGSPSIADFDKFIDNNWTDLGQMNSSAAYAAACTISSAIYLAGGIDHTAQLDKYTVASGWVSGSLSGAGDAPKNILSDGSTAYPVYCARMMEVSNKGYLIAGYTTSGVRNSLTSEYDPSGDTWTAQSPMSYGATHGNTPAFATIYAGFAISSDIYVIPANANDGEGYCLKYTPATDIWDFAVDWEATTGNITNQDGFELSGSGYVCGGADDTLQEFPTVKKFTPAATIASVAPMNSAKVDVSCASANSKGYAFGGARWFPTIVLQDCEEYAPNVWTNKLSMPTPPRRAAASVAL